MFPKYFQQELATLRELGSEFSKAHPSLAPLLSGVQSDPDVERLLEGTAFLTAQLRQKLDDDFPEIVNDLIQVVAPQYLHPTPSATIQVFTPKSTVKDTMRLPAGVHCSSIPVDGISCIFRTVYPVDIHPMVLSEASYVQSPGKAPAFQLSFQLNGTTLDRWKPERLRLFLGDEFSAASALYRSLRCDLQSISLIPEKGGRSVQLRAGSLKAVGFQPQERLVPAPSHAFPGFGLLQDYFALPQAFLFLDLMDWNRWTDRGNGDRFQIRFELTKAPKSAPRITKTSFILNATPAVNLFPHDADPILLDHRRTYYPVRASGLGREEYEIFSVDEVKGFLQGTAEERTYQSFDRFHHPSENEPTYHLSHRASSIRGGTDIGLAVSYGSEGALPAAESLSVRLTCTHGSLPRRLKAGDVSIHGRGCPEYVTVSNLIPPTSGSFSAVGKDMLWKLVSHLSLGLQSLERLETLKSLLSLYIFTDENDPITAVHRRRVEGVTGVRITACDELVFGVMMRGRTLTLTVREDHFAGSGDLYLFGSVLNQFLTNYASINSFIRLSMHDASGGNRIQWSPQLGSRPIL